MRLKATTGVFGSDSLRISERDVVCYVSICVGCEARKSKFNEGIDAIEQDSHTAV
jgi:hypothetical protein